MSANPSAGITDEEIERLINDDDDGLERNGTQGEDKKVLKEAFGVLRQHNDAREAVGPQIDATFTGEAVRSIWGSSVEVTSVMANTLRFIQNFKKETDPEDSLPYYIRILGQMTERNISYINLDMQHMRHFDEELFETAVSYPQEVIPIFDAAFIQIYRELYMNDDNRAELEAMEIETRPFNLNPKPMRELDPENIDTLVTIKGMIIRTSAVMPDMQIGFFECLECKETVSVRISDGRILEPSKCDRCQQRNCMAMVHNRCVYLDKQIVKLQEAPDTVPEGATPQTVQLSTHNLLVDFCRPGDKVLVTGIFRAGQVRQSARETILRQLFKTYLDVVHFRRTERGTISGSTQDTVISAPISDSTIFDRTSKTDKENSTSNIASSQPLASQVDIDTNRVGIVENEYEREEKDRMKDDDEAELEEKNREEEFRRLAARPDIYDLLVRSLAPSIWEMEDVKRGILCQLFGGSSKFFAEKTIGKFRAEINVLLCGDPGTSKSQLLQYVHKLAPRGIYTSGKGSSAVGLTAYITKDEDTGESVLESGALTLSDRGICCIDEFDKMSDSTRSILHEAMEQQTVSVAKAGIIATLNARTSILASANPRESRYNTKLSVVENIQLPPTLLSRFDLIYLVLDTPNRDSDSKLARHIVSMYSKKRMEGSKNNGNSNENAENGRSDSFTSERVGTMDVDEGVRHRGGGLRNGNLNRGEGGTIVLSTETLRRYIAFAKRVCTPVLTDAAGTALVRRYLTMRRRGSNQNTITATTRQLESLIRLSEALAKMRLSNTVTVEDVDEANRLMEVATYAAALDPTTGRIDMDLINTGRGSAHEMVIKGLVQQVSDIIQQYSTDSVHEDQLYATVVALSSDNVQYSDFLEAMHFLTDQGTVAISGIGKGKMVRFLAK